MPKQKISKTATQKKSYRSQSNGVKKRKYYPGMHGFKTREQKRLENKFGKRVFGKTHESEHPIQASLFANIHKTTRRKVENPLPAYQELYEWHRNHSGTGTGRKTKFITEKGKKTKSSDTGFPSAEAYRKHQKSTLEEGSVSNSIQLQQLGMAFSVRNTGLSNSKDNETRISQSNDSYRTMLNTMGDEGKLNDWPSTPQVEQLDLAEAHLSRKAALSGEWPSPDDFTEARKKAKESHYKSS